MVSNALRAPSALDPLMAEAIDWGKLPNIPRIMVDFVAGQREVVSLLGGDPGSDSARRSVLEKCLGWPREAGLGAAIREGYKGVEPPEAAQRNLEALDRPDTLAVVTCQQSAIFGGPLYCFYKGLTAILLAETLASEAPAAVVPVLWMENTESDLSEVNRVNFPSRSGAPRRAIYTPGDMAVGRAVSFHELDPDIDRVVSEVTSWLEGAPYSGALRELIVETHQPGLTMSDCFLRFITGTLGERGLVIVDPLNRAIAERARGFWDRCLDDPDGLNQAIAAASQEIQALRLPLQVRLREDALPILHIDERGTRKRICGRAGAWRVGQEGQPQEIADLRKMGADGPGLLAASTLLRPILQGWLLPVWIQVSGPTDIACQAQTGNCYELLQIPRPLTLPRISATLVERPERRLLDRHNWSVTDVFGGREILLRRRGRREGIEELFGSGTEQLKGWLERIERATESAGVDISTEIDQVGRKLNYQWDKLRRVTLSKIALRDKVRGDHARRLSERILPDGILQERYDSPLHYLANYGSKLIDTILREVNLMKPQHLVLDLEPQDRDVN